jgi:hypothetical protein
MKVLFLDIDGVLNCESTKEKIGGSGPYRSMHGLDARLLKMLLSWLDKHPDVQVVISSTWRQQPETLCAIADAGIPYIGITRTMRNRATEIDDWLSRHPDVSHYAILDDIQQFNAAQRPRFVQTSYVHGLRGKDLRRIEDILG